MKNLTIKKKIIIWFTLALLIIIVISEAITFAFANRVLRLNTKERLESTVLQNVEEIEFYKSLDGHEREEGDHYVQYNNGWLEIDDDFMPYQDGIYTVLLNSDGDSIFGKNLTDYPDEQNFKFTTADALRLNGMKYYVYETKLTSPDGLWLRGYISTSENTNLMYNFVRISLWLIPILALLALIGGYLITRRSLRPIAALATSAEDIGRSGDLSRRLDIGEGNDEIHQLADTFNGMFDKLEKNFEAEKQFSSDVSHELRTPTAVIMAQSEYALDLAETKEECMESFEVIHRQSKLMDDMINQLLFFSRLELGTQSINIEATDISELTERIAKEQGLLGTKGISIETSIEKGVTKDVDVSLYTRMLNNLIGNAYKYGKPGGHIRISLNSEELIVSDDGIGISEDNLDKIWNRFFQVDSSRTEKADGDKGIGLGLSMVKQISSILGFEITVESEENIGTTFHIHL